MTAAVWLTDASLLTVSGCPFIFRTIKHTPCKR